MRFVFPPPSSGVVVTAMSVVSFASMANAGLSELRGKHMEYSKFWKQKQGRNKAVVVDSRRGMIVCYTPAFLAALLASSFPLTFPHENFRFFLLTSALSIHFFKRIFEVPPPIYIYFLCLLSSVSLMSHDYSSHHKN